MYKCRVFSVNEIYVHTSLPKNNEIKLFLRFPLELAHIMTAIVLVTVGYVGCNAALAVALFPVATAFSGAYCSGHMPNHLDLSPNFAGNMFRCLEFTFQRSYFF